MSPIVSPELFTMVQLSGRVGISPTRARQLHDEGKLPGTDGTDAEGRPLWAADTIDAWCRSTGRDVAADAVWLRTAPDATEPATVLFDGLIDGRRMPGIGRRELHAIVWGTEHGQMVYLSSTDSDSYLPRIGQWDPADTVRASAVVAPRFWDDTLIVVPLDPDTEGASGAWVVDALVGTRQPMELCRLRTDARPGAAPHLPLRGGPSPLENAFRDQVYRLLGREPAPLAGAAGAVPAVEQLGIVTYAEVARVLGMPVPVWIRGTRRPDTIARAAARLSSAATLAVADTTTAWPTALARLGAARDHRLDLDYPAGWRLLAADALSTLELVRTLLDLLPSRGDGWFLAARPAPPQLPIELQLDLAELPPVTELEDDQVITDLRALRTAEAALPADDPRGDVYAYVAAMLAVAAEIHHPDVAVDTNVIITRPANGDVTRGWLDRLSRHDDPARVLETRRGERLTSSDPWFQQDLLIDHAGRLVVRATGPDGPTFRAEWPIGLPAGWNDSTMLACDATPDGRGPLLAVTRGGDGTRIDPVPIPPGQIAAGIRPDSGPAALYATLMRIAVDSPLGRQFWPPPGSTLWKTLLAPGPLALRWHDVCQWARDDAARQDAEAPGLAEPSADGQPG